MKKSTRFFLILSFSFLIVTQNLNAEDGDIPQGLNPEAALLARISGLFQREDPSSLYNFQVYDEEVEFILDGSWEAGFSAKTLLNFAPKGSTFSFIPPIFTQSVDLMSWIFINQTWYFESTFSEGFSKNTLAAGYVGTEDTVVKHVRLGNSGIIFPSIYPFVSIGGGTVQAPGISASFGGNKWKADAIIRYDTTASHELFLSGMNEISDTIVPLTASIKGKWFILPTAPITGAITVYIEDANGNVRDSKGRTWRVLNLSEYSISALNGTIELKTPATTSIAIVHENSSVIPTIVQFLATEKNWFSEHFGSEHSELVDMYFPFSESEIESTLIIEIDGQRALILREKNHFSPFEIQNRYEISSDSAIPIFQESKMEAHRYQISPYSDTFSSLNTAGSVEQIRATSARYPLLNEFPRIYLPSFGGFPPDTDLCIRERSFKSIQSISLGADVVNGTIMVYRDGTSDFRFTFDDQNGILELDRPPRSGEQIKITWKKIDESQRNGALIAAAGIQWNALPKLDLRSAMSLAWNIAPTAWTDSNSSSPGTTKVTASATWKSTELTLSTAYAVDLTVPDTTGYYRIEGMEKTPQTRYPEASWYRPIPNEIVPDLNDSGNTIENPELHINTKIPPSYSNELLIVQESSVSGDILFINCDLSVTQNPLTEFSWSGAEILTGSKGEINFEGISSFSVSLKNTDIIGTEPLYDIYIQAGIGDASFYEDSNIIKTWKIPKGEQPKAGENWVIWTVLLDPADRARLSNSGNIRLIVVPKETTADSVYPVRVRLQSGPMEFSGSNFTAHTDMVGETENAFSINEERGSIADSLVLMAPDIVGRFNAGGKNTVLATRFTPAHPSGSILISRIIPEIPLTHYRSFSFYIRPEQLPQNVASSNPTIEISLEGRTMSASEAQSFLGSNKAGEYSPVITITIPVLEGSSALQAKKWHKITVDKDSGDVFINDSTIPSPLCTVQTNSSDTRITRITLAMKNWEQLTPFTGEYDYTVYIDEFFLSDAIPAWNLQNENSLTYKKNGSIVNLGKSAILSNPFIELQQRNTLDPDSGGIDFSASSRGGINVIGATLEGSLSGSNSAPHVIETQSHRITIPAGPFVVSEVFSTRFSDLQMYRNNSLTFSPLLKTNIQATNEQTGNIEKQGSILTLSPKIPQGKNNNFKLEVKTIANQKFRSEAVHLLTGNWPQIWQDSAVGLISEGHWDAIERNTVHTLDSNWSRKNSADRLFFWNGVQINAEAKSMYITGKGSNATETSTLSLPFSLYKSTATGSWIRCAQRLTPEKNGGSYKEDISYVFDSIQKQNWFYTVPPFYDLFVDTVDYDIEGMYGDSIVFSNRYKIFWKRPSPGLLRDLFIPSSMEFSTGRNTETSLEYQKDTWDASVKAGFSALNIAGTKGIVPLFTWYEQDEIAQLYAWNATWGKGFFQWNLDTWQSITLFLTNDGTVAAENAFHYTSPQITGKNELTRDTVRIVWKRKTGETIASKFIHNWYKNSITNVREDSIVCTITYTDEVSLTTSYLRLLQLQLDKRSAIKLSGSADVSQSKKTGVSIGISLGIGGTLTF